jgi:hypothetical protein
LEDPEGDGFDALTEITSTAYANTPTFPGLSAGNLNQVQNVPQSELQPYLTPITGGGDNTPPDVAVTAPNGGEIITANQPTNITWTASDPSGVASIGVYESADDGLTFVPVALGLTNNTGPESGSYTWFPANRPRINARIMIVAVDGAANRTNDVSDSVFRVVSPVSDAAPTTLRDFDMPGSQPLELTAALTSPQECASCHGGYDPNVEPYFNWQGSMMAHSSRDPLFEACLAIANQDAADSGDLCLRCHVHNGWSQGRSVPTDGSALLDSDKVGVSCNLCHRLIDPIYDPGTSPTNDLAILAAMLNPGTNFASAMVHLDPQDTRRGPFEDIVQAGHGFVVSPFHREAALCGTCHDVSNPAYIRDTSGVYQLGPLDAAATDFNPHKVGVVERTYSEWLASDFNTPQGVYLPEFAGNKTNGFVATCQDCHMRDVVGYGCTSTNAPLRGDLPLHDMTGHSTWIPFVIANLYSNDVNAAAITAGVTRATYILENAADMALWDSGDQLQVSVTNNCGHKLPTGYPEGRRMWINVQFLDAQTNLIGESCAYDPETGVLAHDDPEAKIYEIEMGIGDNVTNLFGLPEGTHFHFVLNNKTFSDNRIPPRGFTNAAYAAFGGAPVGYSYADGQYWDDTLYTVPSGTVQAEVKLYFQSTSKEFIEFLRDENDQTPGGAGQAMYDLWNNNGKCPPTLMQEAVWQTPLTMDSFGLTTGGDFEIVFHCRPGHNYTIEHTDTLSPPNWQGANYTPVSTPATYADSAASVTGMRFYRVTYLGAP